MEYIATGDSLTAYKAAGYAPGRNHADTRRRAGTLLKKPKIEQRINDLREVALDRMAWSADHVLQRLDEVYQHALSNGDRSEQRIKMGALGDSDEKEKVQNDIERLAEIAGFKVIEGGKQKDGTTDNE